MLQGALTLLTRSLRGDARLRRAHAFRIVSVLILFGLLIEAHVMSSSVGAPGLRFFWWICFLSCGLITLAGFSFFSSVISEEKEDGTLSLLKLADLSTLSIITGKSTSRLVAALLVFAGQFPFALLAITLGGVTVHQVWSAYVALAAYLVLIANVALLCSVVSRRSGMASVLVLLACVTYLGVAPLLHSTRGDLERNGLVPTTGPILAVWNAVQFVYESSIITRLLTILRTGFAAPAFGLQFWSSLVAGALCFLTACLVFNRFTEYVDASTPSRGIVPRLRSRRLVRVLRAWRWPLVWKDFHFIAGGPLLIAGKLLVYPLLIWLLYLGQDWVQVMTRLSFHEAAWTTAGVLAGAELLLYATRIFQHERKWGTLPCLALLPRAMPWIGYAKLGGCLLGSLPTILLLLGLALITPIESGQRTPWLLQWQVVATLVVFALILQLTALFSLIVRWGALPLAVATMLVGGTCLFPILGAALSAVASARQGDFAQLGPILYTGGVLSAVLQLLIGLRFRAAAGD